MSIWIAIIYCGYIRMCINPDDSDILILSMQIIKWSKRYHAVTAYSNDPVWFFY